MTSCQTLAASFGTACCMRRSDGCATDSRQSDLCRQRHRDNLLLVRLCNRLIAVLYNNATITPFGYDAFGQRVYPIITTTSTDHVSVLERALFIWRYGELGVSRLRAA